MLKKLFPRNENFFAFFENHAAMSVLASKELLRFAALDSNPIEVFQNIKSWEQKADMITHHCIEALHKSFITPLERQDIHLLISTMDNVIDEIEDVGKFLLLYKLKISDDGAKKLAECLLACCIEMEKAVKELKKVKNTKEMQKHFYNINHFENEADSIFIASLEKLLNEEKDTLFFIKWKEIYEHLEHAIDACEDVANILEGIVLEYD